MGKTQKKSGVSLDVSMEFRGFVKNGRLCALSQYNHLCFFPELLPRRAELESQIRMFFEEKIRSRLAVSFDDYVIDFAVTESDVWVIELNPFMETTDGCLFSWQSERHILEGRRQDESVGIEDDDASGSGSGGASAEPFEFRLAESVRNGAKALVAHDWRLLMESGGEDWTAGGLRG
jgi:hypothetical protein